MYVIVFRGLITSLIYNNYNKREKEEKRKKKKLMT